MTATGNTSTSSSLSFFDRHPRATIFASIMLGSAVLLLLTEFCLRYFLGLGNPVLYDSSPVYGYRPLPDQELVRFGGARIHFNNLGLRADQDWDAQKNNKILFLGDSVTYGGSSVDNRAIFSRRATELWNAATGQHFIDGNAGVNAWGVLNIYGLLVEKSFQPAAVYVTVLPEADFYRGLTRMQGLPFFNISPRYAFAELWYFFCEKQNEHRYQDWTAFASVDDKRVVLIKAVQALKALDDNLTSRGYRHLVFITPTQQQVFDGAPVDAELKALLNHFRVRPVYLLHELQKQPPAASERNAYFRDDVHLQAAGHEAWARIIAAALAGEIPPPVPVDNH